MNSRLTIPRLFISLLLLLATSGCAGWRAVKSPPAEYIAKENPDVVRLSLAESRMVLSRPAVHGDSVIGLSKAEHPHRWVTVPEGSIQGMEIHTTRGTRGTKIAAISITTLLVSFAVLVVVSDGNRNIY
jgi:hypothetical protein